MYLKFTLEVLHPLLKYELKKKLKIGLIKNIAEIGENPSSEDKEWINTVEEGFYSCYANILD